MFMEPDPACPEVPQTCPAMAFAIVHLLAQLMRYRNLTKGGGGATGGGAKGGEQGGASASLCSVADVSTFMVVERILNEVTDQYTVVCV